MKKDQPTPNEVALKLVDFYDQPFGGKAAGRFRISPKNLRKLTQRRRLSDDFVRQLADAMFELEYVFIDMESFYVVTSSRTFTNYRRVADTMVAQSNHLS